MSASVPRCALEPSTFVPLECIPDPDSALRRFPQLATPLTILAAVASRLTGAYNRRGRKGLCVNPSRVFPR